MRRVKVGPKPAPPAGCFISCHPSTNHTDAVEANTSIVPLFLSKKGSTMGHQQKLNGQNTWSCQDQDLLTRTSVQDLLRHH